MDQTDSKNVITVKLLGGAKRSFASDKISIDKDSITVGDLLEYLKNSVQKDGPAFDVRNILVAVNGADSSALQGNETLVRDGDTVSIIPVIHGGGTRRMTFKISGNAIELMRLGKTGAEPVDLLDRLRARFPSLIIQGIDTRYILGENHARRIIEISLAAAKAGVLLSNKLETDVLMRFAQSRQIGDAIRKVGLKKDKDSILIVMGQKSQIDKLVSELGSIIKPMAPFPDNSKFIKKEFEITAKELGSIISKEPLEDILVERSAVLLI